MKNIITIIIAIVSFSGISQSQYQKGMQKGLDFWKEGKSSEAINLFERIAKAEKDQWLPSYYASYITLIECFSEKDETILKTKMDKALLFMNEARAINKDDVELLILEALWYTVWVAYDGNLYGMKYGGKVTALYQEALNKAPNNPRVILNKAEWDIGGAKFFGQPIEPYCKEIQRAIDLFKDYNPDIDFYPKGGAQRAKDLLKENCN